MLRRRDFLRGAALSPLALAAMAKGQAPPAPKTVTVVVDFSPESTAVTPVPTGLSSSAAAVPLTPWEKWAGFDSSAGESTTASIRTLAAAPPGLVIARAVRNALARRVGVALTNTSGEPIKVRLEAHLGSGLWRVEAATIEGSNSAEISDGTNPPAKTWRMESILRPADGAVVKTLPVQAGQTLFVRFAETVRDAEQSLHLLQARTASVGVTTYSGESVPGALGRVADIVSVLPTLVEQNNRPEIIKRVHRALLTVAQAEAMAQNAQQAHVDERDAAFDALTLALSEISCASWNLVPRQNLEPGAGGKTILRVSVTNGGTRTLPLLSLAVEGVSGGEAKNARPVFRSVAPGASVSAQFLLQGGDESAARGVAQFIVGMGAASVYSQPSAPPLASVLPSAEAAAAP